MSRLAEHGLKFAVIDRYTYENNRKRGLEEVAKNASLSLKKLEKLDPQMVMVGLTGTGVDVVIKTHNGGHRLLDSVYAAIPAPIAQGFTSNGEEIYFLLSTGLGSCRLPGITLHARDGDVALPSGIEWLALPDEAPSDSILTFGSALERWADFVEQQLAIEHDERREREYLERREREVIAGPSSKLRKSIKKVRNSYGLRKLEIAVKQAYHLGNHTDDNPRLNKFVLDSLMNEVLQSGGYSGEQISELERSLEQSLKNGVANNRRASRR